MSTHSLHKLGFALFLSLFAFSLNSQILLNELSPDAGNNDAANDAIVELINYGPSTDAGCMVISNSEWVVVLPPGTNIPVGGTFIIACSEGMNSGSNSNPNPGTGLTCAVCDFPNLPLDFDVCDPANAAYIDWASSGFTLDNTSQTDGDQVVLFQADGTLADAVQWGDGASFPGVDNTVISGSGYGAPASYTLGDSTPLNSNGSATAQLPAALQAGGVCATTGTSYVMPAIDSGVYYNASPVQKSCNSSMIRVTGNAGSASSGQWLQTEHPSPGEANDSPPFQFFVNGDPVSTGTQEVSLCSAPAPVTITVQVYGYQHVEDVALNTTGTRTTLGSYFSLNGSAPVFWNGGISGAGTGTTTLTHTFTPVDEDQISLVWDDWTQSPYNPNCCGTTSQNVAQSGNDMITAQSADECYEAITINYAVDFPLTGTAAITCDDAATGNISVSGITGGTNITYEILRADDSVFASNTTGMFVLPSTAGDVSDFRVFAVNPCGNIQATGVVCVGNPPCPDPMGATINGATTALTICPEDCFNLTIDGAASSNLPDGGTVDWYYGTDANFDPFNVSSTGFGGQLDTPSDITVAAGSGGGGVIINEVLYDPTANDGSNPWDESIELFNSSGASIDISNWVLTDGDFAAIVPANTILASGGYFIIDFDSALTNSGEQIGLYNGAGVFIDGMFYENGQDINTPTDSDCSHEIPLAAGGTMIVNVCSDIINAGITNAGSSGNGESLERNADGTWSAATPATEPLEGGPNTNQTQVSGGSVATVSTANNCFDESFCNNGPYFIKGIINPTPFSASCTESDVIVGSFEVNVVCPTIILSSLGDVCAPMTAAITATVSNVTTGSTINLVITNGTSTFSAVGNADGSGNATLFIGDIDSSGDYSVSDLTTVTGSTCSQSSSIVTIIVSPQPNITLSGSATVCPGEAAFLNLTSTSGEFPLEVTYSIDGSPTGTISVGATGMLAIPTTVAQAGTNISVDLLSVVDDNGCIGTVSGTALVNVSSIESQPIAATNQNICVPANTTLSNISFEVNDTGNNTTVNVYENAIGGTILSGGNDIAGGTGNIIYTENNIALTSTFPQTVTRYFEVTNSITSCTNFTRTAVEVTVNEQAVAGTPMNTTACSSGATNDAGQTDIIDLDDQLTDASAGGTWTQVGTTPATATIEVNNSVDFTSLAAGNYTFLYTVGTAPCNTVTSNIEIIVSSCGAPPCSPPTITNQPIPMSVCSDNIPQIVPFSVTATNVGSGTTLNYQWQASNDGINYFSLTDGFGTTGTNSANLMLNVFTTTQNGLLFRVVVTDPLDAANCSVISNSVLLSIDNAPNVSLNDPTDVCIDGADRNFSASPTGGSFSSNAPAGFTFDNNAGTAILDVSAAGAGMYDVTYDFTDANGCSASQTVSVEVFATPMASPSVNLPVCEGSIIELSANSTDVVTYLWTGPNGFTSTDESPTITAADETYPGAGTFIYNLTISTNAATSCSASFSVEVIIDPAPAFVCRQPISTTTLLGECERDIILLEPIILDESTGISGISSDAPTLFPIGETIVTWTVTDLCGNARTCEQSVSVADVEGPIFSACNQEIGWTEGNCIANVTVSATATDNCGIVSITGTGNYQFEVGVYPLVLLATDINGNVTEHLFTVYVHDDIAPTAVICPENFTIDINDEVTLPTPSFIDNCEIYTLINDAPDTFEEGTTTVTWTASDYYGLTTDCVYDVTVTETLISIENLHTIEASIDTVGALSRVQWNSPTASSYCDSCAETTYENYEFLGEFYGHQYFSYTGEKVDWNTAKVMAESTFDGHLLSINDISENNFVKHHLLQNTDSLWLGLSETANAENLISFTWSNADETDFYNFGDILSYQNDNGAVIMTQSGTWRNASKIDLHRFIVERPCLDFVQISPNILTLNNNEELQAELLENGEEWAEGSYLVEYRAEDQCGYLHSGFFPVEVSTQTANYCPTGGADSTLWVSQVNIGTDRHESSNTKNYADYTEEIIDAETETELLSLEIILGGNVENQEIYLRIWVDINEDGDFFDANEIVWENIVYGNVATAEIPVNFFHETGKRLRVAISRYNFAEVCADFFSGEAEDYLVRHTTDIEDAYIPIIPIESGALSTQDINVSPNPTPDVLTINLPDFETDSNLSIFDTSGKLVETEVIIAGSRNFNINFTHRAEGIYFLRLENAGVITYKKVVVSK